MFLNFLSRIKSGKDINEGRLEDAIELVRQNNFEEAMILAMETMKKEDRIKYVVDFISKSHWRINSAALDIFNKVITKFLESKDPKVLSNYLTQLSVESRGPSSSHAHVFYQIRADIIQDLLHDKAVQSALSVAQTFRMEQMMSKDDMKREIDRKFSNTVVDIMSKAWPKKSMLKVLYG